MGLEVPCTLNPRWSAGCPDRARSKSEGYAGGGGGGGGLPPGQTKSAQRLYQTDPILRKGAGSTRFSLTEHQLVPGKPLSVKCSLMSSLDKVNVIGAARRKH